MKLAAKIEDAIERLGAAAVAATTSLGALGLLFVRTWKGAFRRGQRPRGAVRKQMLVIGNGSLLFIAVTLGFIGMVMVYQACLQINRITPGNLGDVGRGFLQLLIQEFAPTITALMLATRVGAGIAAEVGTMKVTEQIDALRMSGITPVDYLIAPRFIASVIMTVALTIFAVAIAYAAGGLTAAATFDVNPNLYFDVSLVRPYDLVVGSIKAVSYGMAIPVISGHAGLSARGSSEGVGAATTNAVISSSFAVIFLDFLISGTAVLMFPPA